MRLECGQNGIGLDFALAMRMNDFQPAIIAEYPLCTERHAAAQITSGSCNDFARLNHAVFSIFWADPIRRSTNSCLCSADIVALPCGMALRLSRSSSIHFAR